MKSSSSKKYEKGQGLVEYSLILVLVGIVVIGALTILGPKIGNVFSNINNSIAVGGGGAAIVAIPTVNDCSTLLAARNAKWQATVGVTQQAMSDAGWPETGPIHDSWVSATSEYQNSSEVSAYNASC